MPIINLPIEPTDQSITEFKTQAQTVFSGCMENTDVTFVDYLKRDVKIFIVDNRFLLPQIAKMIDSSDLDEIASQVLNLPLLSEACFILLPPLSVMAKRLLSSSDSYPDIFLTKVPTRVLKAQSDNSRSTALLKFMPKVVTSSTTASDMLTMSVQNADVYTLTPDVIGMPLRRYAEKSHYPSAFDFGSAHPSNWRRSVIKASNSLLIPMVPVMSTAKTLYLDADFSTSDDRTGIFWRLSASARIRARQRGVIVLPSMIKTFYEKERGLKSAPVQLRREHKMAARLLRIPFGRVPSETSFRRDMVQCCDLLVSTSVLNKLLSPTEAGKSPPFDKYVFHGVPVEFINRVCPDIGTQALGRDTNGYLQEWLIMLFLMSDYITSTTSRRRLTLVTNFDPMRKWYDITLLKITNTYYQCQEMMTPPAISSFGVCSQKGTFKSTLSSWLSQVIVRGVNLFPEGSIVDSDDLGSKLDPTFESEWETNVIEKIGMPVIIRGLTEEGAFKITTDTMFDTYALFRQLYDRMIVPVARHFFDYSVASGRKMIFAHCDSEFLDNSFPSPFYRTHITIDNYGNILNRPNRVGGVLSQYVLAECYRLMATSCKSRPIAKLLKAKLVPWWEFDSHVKRMGGTPVHYSLGVKIQPELMRDAGYCGHLIDHARVEVLQAMWVPEAVDESFFHNPPSMPLTIHLADSKYNRYEPIGEHNLNIPVLIDTSTSYLSETYLPAGVVFTPTKRFTVEGCDFNCWRGNPITFKGTLSWWSTAGE
uniref:Mu 2 protein n=1 Tax=Piscine orthoreovirus TaxID=1157337 RepID=A0A0G2YI43_9REOV|nr:mu 2 protein [Piscine orthoreovirus]QPZ89317.1 Mu2 [Piscine orthoreovirus]QWL55025.1 mu2 [Piscine orthoreovirus]QWL55030.1 mu2 [Piscine orthoreovirus]